jgi:hypothetical protein
MWTREKGVTPAEIAPEQKQKTGNHERTLRRLSVVSGFGTAHALGSGSTLGTFSVQKCVSVVSVARICRFIH